MKIKIITNVMVMLAVLIAFQTSVSSQSINIEKSKNAEINGLVVNETTYENVKEKFLVYFYTEDDLLSGLIKRPDNVVYTDKEGNFTIHSKPGDYYLYTLPVSESQVYCSDPHPLYYPETRTLVRAEAGKTEIVYKEAYISGQMKIILVNPEGQMVIPRNIFPYVYIRDNIENSFIETSFVSYYYWIGDLADGEMIKPMLFPGKYNLELFFNGLGYGSIRLENILVKQGKTTEVKVEMNLKNTTGVQGQVFNQFNSPIEGVKVEVIQEREGENGYRQQAMTYTDANGYYKIFGLEDDLYTIYFSMQSVNGTIEDDFESVYIEENFLTQLDKTVEMKEETKRGKGTGAKMKMNQDPTKN